MQEKTVGIVGGGQLGRMLTEAAKSLGFQVIVVDPNPNCSAAQAGAEQIPANFYDEKAITELGKRADFLTIESEHINTDVLDLLAGQGKPVNPTPTTLRMIQDKLTQKQFLHDNNIPVADFTPINNYEDAKTALEKFGGKMILKTRLGGYDGRGNAVVTDANQLQQAMNSFDGVQLYAEALVPFQKELAVMVARSNNGETAVYRLVETRHERNICVEVLAPAQVDEAIAKKARDLAIQVAGHLDGAGVFGIEMFLDANNNVLVNEIAPRVHNSGHHTIEACLTSQFEQHIRAVTGMELGPTDMVVPAAAMVNILGDRDGPIELEGLENAQAVPETSIHIYGKAPTKIDRKMGHITSTGKDITEARARARKARGFISI